MQIKLWISLKVGMCNFILYFVNHVHCWKKKTGKKNMISNKTTNQIGNSLERENKKKQYV